MINAHDHRVELEAVEQLLVWHRHYQERLSPALLSGMLLSAAAECMGRVPLVTREIFIEMADRAWERWARRRRLEQVPS